MTPKQQRFTEEYLIDLNATQAAIRAGYSEKTAEQQGYQQLQKPSVKQAIKVAQDARSERTGVTVDRVVEELAGIGFHNAPFLSGMECKLSDKLSALDKIGRHLKMFTDKHEHTGADGGPIEVVDDKELARRAMVLLGVKELR